MAVKFVQSSTNRHRRLGWRHARRQSTSYGWKTKLCYHYVLFLDRLEHPALKPGFPRDAQFAMIVDRLRSGAHRRPDWTKPLSSVISAVGGRSPDRAAAQARKNMRNLLSSGIRPRDDPNPPSPSLKRKLRRALRLHIDARSIPVHHAACTDPESRRPGDPKQAVAAIVASATGRLAPSCGYNYLARVEQTVREDANKPGIARIENKGRVRAIGNEEMATYRVQARMEDEGGWAPQMQSHGRVIATEI
ncbi:hypothetical protein V8E53_004536 [Lactarius tabidus]